MMLQLYCVTIIPASTHVHENNCSRLDYVVEVTRIVAYAKTGILRPTIFAAGSRYVMELRNSAHRPVGIGSPTAVYKFCEPHGIEFTGKSLNRI